MSLFGVRKTDESYVFMFIFLFLIITMSVGYVYVGVYTTVFVWSSEDNFLELSPFTFSWMLGLKLGPIGSLAKGLYLLLCIFFFFTVAVDP